MNFSPIQSLASEDFVLVGVDIEADLQLAVC